MNEVWRLVCGWEVHRTWSGVLFVFWEDTGHGSVSSSCFGKTPDMDRCPFSVLGRHRTWIGVLSVFWEDTGPRAVSVCGGGNGHRTWAGVFCAFWEDTGRGPVSWLLGEKSPDHVQCSCFDSGRNKPSNIRAFCRRRPRRLAVCRPGFGFPFALGLGRSDSMLAHLSFKLNPPPLICHKVVFALFTHLTPSVLLSTLVACRSKPSHPAMPSASQPMPSHRVTIINGRCPSGCDVCPGRCD